MLNLQRIGSPQQTILKMGWTWNISVFTLAEVVAVSLFLISKISAYQYEDDDFFLLSDFDDDFLESDNSKDYDEDFPGSWILPTTDT